MLEASRREAIGSGVVFSLIFRLFVCLYDPRTMGGDELADVKWHASHFLLYCCPLALDCFLLLLLLSYSIL